MSPLVATPEGPKVITDNDLAEIDKETEDRVAARITDARKRANARRAEDLAKQAARTAGLAARHDRKINRLGGAPTMPTLTPGASPAHGAPTARTLIDTGGCAPGCLLAVSPPRTCTCPCGGRHHGALGTAAVPTLDPTQAAA